MKQKLKLNLSSVLSVLIFIGDMQAIAWNNGIEQMSIYRNEVQMKTVVLCLQHDTCVISWWSWEAFSCAEGRLCHIHGGTGDTFTRVSLWMLPSAAGLIFFFPSLLSMCLGWVISSSIEPCWWMCYVYMGLAHVNHHLSIWVGAGIEEWRHEGTCAFLFVCLFLSG